MREVSQQLKGRHFLRVADWNEGELLAVLDLADELKAALRAREDHALLSGRSLGMIFHMPSARTRVSFEVGIAQLGGQGIYLGTEFLFGERESIEDTGLLLSRYLDGILIRTFAQRDVDELAANAAIPVINGLTDAAHPCQALADVMTIRERLGRLAGVRIAYIGDGNNVCASLMLACASFGLSFVAAAPEGYEPAEETLVAARERATRSGGSIELVHDPRVAARGADALYTDVWTSMGQEAERERRLQAFAGYRLDADLVALAAPGAIVLHCLPAHYGEEITEDVLHGPQSAAFDQAENRLHAQKALMALVIR